MTARVERTADQCLHEGHSVDVWRDVPYRHATELKDGVVWVLTWSAKSGDGEGDDEWVCDTDGSVLPPVGEVDYA